MFSKERKYLANIITYTNNIRKEREDRILGQCISQYMLCYATVTKNPIVSGGKTAIYFSLTFHSYCAVTLLY